MADPEHISQALTAQLLDYPPGMLAALSRGPGMPSPADQPMLFPTTDDPRRFIDPPSRLAARPSRRDAQRP